MAKAKEDARQRTLRKGLKILRSEDFSIDDPQPAIVGDLKNQIGKDTETDLAAIFLLGRIADPTAVKALSSLEETITDKRAKREIRRSLFKLAQRGFEVPQQEVSKDNIKSSVFKFVPDTEAYMSSVDGSGSRMVWLIRGQVGGGIGLLQGVVNDREGLMQVGGGMLRRKELRRMINEIKDKHGFTMISVPWGYADYLLYKAYEMGKGERRPGLEQFLSLRSHISTDKPEQQPHPIYDYFKPDVVLSGPGRETSNRLHDELEFRSWVLDEDWIKPYLEKLHEAQESRLVLNSAQKEERIGGIVRDAVKELFSGEVETLIAGRMEDMALFLVLTDREESAKSALSVALTLKDEKIKGLGPGNPFLEGLVQKSINFYAVQEKEKKKEEESSLLIKP